MQLRFGYKDEGIKRQRFVSKATGKIEDEYITGLYKVGRYGWILDDIKILKEKIPAKGKLGIWNYESEDL